MPPDFLSGVLDKYGLIGLTVIFSGYVIKRVLDFLMASADTKDKANKELGDKFAAALDGNTKIMSELNGSVIKLTDASSNIVGGFDRLAEQGRQEHAQILDHVKRTGTR